MKQIYELKEVTGLNKIQIIESANQLADEIIDEGDILRAVTDIKRLTEYLTTLKERLSDEAVNEAYKHTDSKDLEFAYKDALLKVQSRGRYDYKSCKDIVWDKLKAAIEDRQEFLKALKEELSVNDPKTGEVFTILPPIKSGKSSLNIKLL